jgi:hypothetical protein
MTNRKKSAKKLTPKQKLTLKARMRLLKEAQRTGVISSEKARAITGLPQVWYHLNAMVKAGMLRYAGYNQWLPKR